MVVVGEGHVEGVVGYSVGIDEQTVETVEVGRRLLQAVDCGYHCTHETHPYEGFHSSWVVEGKGGTCGQTHEDVVCVDLWRELK